ncbi:MAG: NADH:flavin oxidoreductase/NADH oxidase [Rhodospirillales bacterium]|nr:NADH:flavin oxidoreductase/NADH oxidase [Rhodospirillales bacterium]MDE2197892.1 NADH:flavin oxidoreductase/NADH oxidase [Rhodospirillales bacterium]MDE2575528.1 NADH:flavin oxidoreductase/NADH oxidase [Rhodospirillales bacterium]
MPAVKLFEPISFRSVTAPNRITLSPMCQYSATEGLGDDWHVQHLGARAMGGAGIVFTEACHVSAIGRITPWCLGLYTPEHQALLTRIATLISRGGAVPGLQISHAGRKASVEAPWRGSVPIAPEAGGWVPVGPSAVPFGAANTVPKALDRAGIADIIGQFAATARMAREAGFKVIEVHGAHGYLLHAFTSPISNRRNDAYGGDLAGRSRMLMEVIEAVRGEWPAELPLFVRLSAVDWMAGGITLDETIELCRRLKATGLVDLIDCSSGGVAASGPQIPSLHPGYQVPFAEAVRREAGIATGAVGMITAPEHAAEIIANGRADLVFLARALLADPGWPLRAARRLGAEVALLPQYARATVTA